MPRFAVEITTRVVYHVDAETAEEAERLAVVREDLMDMEGIPEAEAEQAKAQAKYITDSFEREAEAKLFCPGDGRHGEHDPTLSCEEE